MKSTRNLFVMHGNPLYVSSILEALTFKGMISCPYGTKVTDSFIDTAFKNNKSVVCSAEDYVGAKDYICLWAKDFAKSTNVAADFADMAEQNNCDIGDHKSNSSGLKGTPTIADCAYCRYLKGVPDNNERTVYESENFFVIPTIGQFITGYLLIIPYEHVMSNGQLDITALKEFEIVLEDIEYLLKLTYNAPNVLVWENGSGNSGVGKAKDSVVHSHVHVCPSSLTSESIEKLSGFPFDTISLEELEKYKEHSYLLVRTPDYSKWKINNNPQLYIPRQYVRQLVAEEYGLKGDSWNWRTCPFTDKMYQTVEDIKLAIQTNFDSIPKRIKERTSILF